MSTDIDKKILELEEEITRLKQEKAKIEKTPDNKRLAFMLHAKKCRWDHTEGCGWFYEINKGVHDWEGYAHKRYLEEANKILSKISFESAVAALEAGI